MVIRFCILHFGDGYQSVEGSNDVSEQLPPPLSFLELELKVKESIELLSGVVSPKLN